MHEFVCARLSVWWWLGVARPGEGDEMGGGVETVQLPSPHGTPPTRTKAPGGEKSLRKERGSTPTAALSPKGRAV